MASSRTTAVSTLSKFTKGSILESSLKAASTSRQYNTTPAKQRTYVPNNYVERQQHALASSHARQQSPPRPRSRYSSPPHVASTGHDNDSLEVTMGRLAREGSARACLELYNSLPPNRIHGRLGTLVLQSIINSNKITNKGFEAEKVWKQMKVKNPNIILFNCLMNAHSKSYDDPDRGEKAERWLRRAEEIGLQPDSFSYTSVVHAYVQTNLDHAERMFDEYRERHKNKIEGGPFCALMTGWSTKSRERTEQLMQQMMDAKLVPPVHAFMAVLKSLGCEESSDAGVSANEWCLKFIEITKRQPDQRMWCLVLHAWSKSGCPNAGVEADLIMKELLSSGMPIATPVYNAWMNCWTKTRDPTAVHRVQDILHALERNSFNSPFEPDALSYSAAIQAWAKSGLPEAPIKAEELLARMQEPTGKKRGVAPILICYEALMDAHARSSSGLQRVLQILGIVEAMASSGAMKLSARTYSPALLAMSHNPDVNSTTQAEAIISRMTDFGVTPTAHCYSLLITVYANDRWDKDAHRKASDIMDRMRKAGETPNAHIYAGVISVLANHGDTDMAKSLWMEFPESTNAIYVLNAVLNAFRRKGTIEAAEEAESLLRSAIKTIEPDKRAFSIVMSAWAQFGRVDRTMALLDEMKRDYPECNDTYLYGCAMDAYVNSDDAIDAAFHVEQLLQEMEHFGHRPNNIVLTTAIKAYMRNPDYREKAAALMKLMEDEYSANGDESMKPLSEAYGMFA